MIHPDIHPDQHFRSQATVLKCTSKDSWDTLIAVTALQKLVFPVDSFFFSISKPHRMCFYRIILLMALTLISQFMLIL